MINEYMYGKCMILAHYLSKKHGHPCVGIYDKVWTTIPKHVAVKNGDYYFDARGWLTENDFLDGYNDAVIKNISIERIEEIWGYRVDNWDIPNDLLKHFGYYG